MMIFATTGASFAAHVPVHSCARATAHVRTSYRRMTEERHTLSEAASLLGITPDALRQRIRRGRYRAEKVAGRVYVYLDTDRTQTERPTEQGTDALIPELRARIESLERQLDQEREANRENRRLTRRGR